MQTTHCHTNCSRAVGVQVDLGQASMVDNPDNGNITRDDPSFLELTSVHSNIPPSTQSHVPLLSDHNTETRGAPTNTDNTDCQTDVFRTDTNIVGSTNDVSGSVDRCHVCRKTCAMCRLQQCQRDLQQTLDLMARPRGETHPYCSCPTHSHLSACTST